MRFFPPAVPPELTVSTGWRALWRVGAFVQLELETQSGFASSAKERGLSLGTGEEVLEQFDAVGALQPIAFAGRGQLPKATDLAPYEKHVTFREEQDRQLWSAYAWADRHGHEHTTALYSPWQLLYLDDVIERSSERLSLSTLVGPGEELVAWVDRLRERLGDLYASWASLHERWMPLSKLLVRIQNRYLPQVTGRSILLRDPETQVRIEPWAEERVRFDANTTAKELGVDSEQVLRVYWWLVERGIEREPRDEMDWLRRARPRSAHRHWHGPARRAQDHFHAAQMLRLFLTDLLGEEPGRPTMWPMDGRQPFRAAIYERGPVPNLNRGDLKAELVATGLYPHSVHVVGEGRSEKEFVTAIVSEVLGAGPAKEIGFTDLGGSGSASRLPTMVSGLTSYAQRTVVIVDSEGEMEQYATGLERSGDIPGEDILRFALNLEDSNFEPQELIEVLKRLAANPPDGLPAVTLKITVEQLAEEYARRRLRANEDPGLAGILLGLAEDPANGGPARISKPQFASALATRMLDDLEVVEGDDDATQELYRRRPLLRFSLERIVQLLAELRW